MADDLKQLLEKIQHEGVEKAQAQALTIVQEAQKKAQQLVADATTQAQKLRQQAQTDATATAARAEKSIQQAARDVVLGVKEAIQKLLEDLLTKQVEGALRDPKLLTTLIARTLETLVSSTEIEIAVDEKLVPLLQAKLISCAHEGVRVVSDARVGDGFSVRLEGGRVEYDFSQQAIAQALAARVRPALQKLIAP